MTEVDCIVMWKYAETELADCSSLYQLAASYSGCKIRNIRDEKFSAPSMGMSSWT